MKKAEMNVVNEIFQGEYRDSLFLMKLSDEISSWPNVEQAVIVMGTESNKHILHQLELLSIEAQQATSHDLIIAAKTSLTKGEFISALENRMQETEKPLVNSINYPSLDEALSSRPDINLVSLSIPGEYASDLVRSALLNKKHVFLFSHHISIEKEIQLKKLAIQKDVLLMGPDCGTAILDGNCLGFSNKVSKGPISIVSASGSGLQEVTSLIDRQNGGIYQAIGVGGRDLSKDINGLMSEHAIRNFIDIENTKVIVILAKKASPLAIDRVLKAASQTKVPVIANFEQVSENYFIDQENVILTDTFEECAYQALKICGIPWKETSNIDDALNQHAKEIEALPPNGRILGLYGGGSLCAEALSVMDGQGLSMSTNLQRPLDDDVTGNVLIDLGSEEFTQGRPHPFIDSRIRNQKINEAWNKPELAILLLDVVLGYGCHPDPAGEIVKVINNLETSKSKNKIVIASVCGTESDSQCYSQQRKKLEEVGIVVMESNAQAATIATRIFKRLEE